MAESTADCAVGGGCAGDHRGLGEDAKGQGLIARSSRIRGAGHHGCVARRARRAANQATGRIQRQAVWQGSFDRIGGGAVAGGDLITESTTDRAVGRGRASDHRGLGEDCYFQSAASSSMTVRC